MTNVPLEEETKYFREQYPESTEFLEKAMQAENNPKKEQAYFRKAHEVSPENPEATLFYVMTHEDEIERLHLYEEELAKYQKVLEKNGFWNDEHFGHFEADIETRYYLELLNNYAEDLVNVGRLSLAVDQYREILRLEAKERAYLAIEALRLMIQLERFEDAHSFVKSLKLKDFDHDEQTEIAFLKLLLAYKEGKYDQMVALMNEVNGLNEYLLENIYFAHLHHHEHYHDFEEEWDDEWECEDDDAWSCDCCGPDCDCGDCPCCDGGWSEEWDNDMECDCGPDCECGCQEGGECLCHHDDKPEGFEDYNVEEDEEDYEDECENDPEYQAWLEEQEKADDLRDVAEEIFFSNHHLLLSNFSFLKYIGKHYDFQA